MAILNITQFFHPLSPDNEFKVTDYIHLGRPSNNTGEKDIYLTGAEFYNSLNQFYALFGAAQIPAALNPVAQIIRQYPDSYQTVSDPATGLITIPTAGMYRIYGGVIYQPDGNTQPDFVTLSVKGSVFGSVTIDVKTNADGSNQIHMIGNTFLSLAAGETVGLYLQSNDTRNIVINDAQFEIKPLFV